MAGSRFLRTKNLIFLLFLALPRLFSPTGEINAAGEDSALGPGIAPISEPLREQFTQELRISIGGILFPGDLAARLGWGAATHAEYWRHGFPFLPVNAMTRRVVWGARAGFAHIPGTGVYDGQNLRVMPFLAQLGLRPLRFPLPLGSVEPGGFVAAGAARVWSSVGRQALEPVIAGGGEGAWVLGAQSLSIAIEAEYFIETRSSVALVMRLGYSRRF